MHDGSLATTRLIAEPCIIIYAHENSNLWKTLYKSGPICSIWVTIGSYYVEVGSLYVGGGSLLSNRAKHRIQLGCQNVRRTYKNIILKITTPRQYLVISISMPKRNNYQHFSNYRH